MEESLEQMQARHRKELKDMQGRITSKKNATKKTRKGVNGECADMERQLRERQAAEQAALKGEGQEEATEGAEEATEGAEEAKEGAEEAKERAEEAGAGEGAATQTSGAQEAQKAAETPGRGQAARKRNRQRERLARRAAEAEAAAQRASEEAAGMTDHRAREGASMRKAMEAHGLVEKEVAPDGHCLFAAVADQLGQAGVALGSSGPEPGWRTVRRAAAGFMEANADDFAPFLDEELAAYAARVRDTAEWGGQLELTALARRYGAEIRVVQDGRVERIGEDEGRATGRTLWLAYYRHGYGLGEHYNSLRKA